MAGKVEFGVFSPQAGLPWTALLDRAKLADKLGYHSIWITDHMWSRGMPGLDYHECLAAMTGLAAGTEKIRIGTLVICQSYRNPAILAKALTTIDHISGGRLEIGIGAGWMDEEYKAYGFEFPPMGVRLKQLAEALQIMKALFTQDRATFKGRYYSIGDAYNNPKPIQKPHPPIMIGGSGEKVMLRIVARYADRWNCPAGYQSFEHKLGVLKEHCKAVNRDINSITISEQLLVCLGTSEAEVEQKWQMATRFPFAKTGIKGTPAQVVAQLKDRVRLGLQMFTIFFSDLAPPQTLELFANEVMPAFA